MLDTLTLPVPPNFAYGMSLKQKQQESHYVSKIWILTQLNLTKVATTTTTILYFGTEISSGVT